MQSLSGFTEFVAEDGAGFTVVFGANSAQTALGPRLEALGAKKIALVTTQSRAAATVALVRPVLAPGMDLVVVPLAQQHVPATSVDEALALLEGSGVDTILSVGGGSTVGLAKALTARLPGTVHASVPTTYSGSEMTHIYGVTSDGIKHITKDPRTRPRLVVYDSTLSLNLPLRVSYDSAFNAMAHAVEAMYSAGAPPPAVLSAQEGIRVTCLGLDGLLKANPSDSDLRVARDQLLYGAYLCGLALYSTPMGVHHKACHVLGGLLNLPHADTHACFLPHALYYNSPACPAAAARIGAALGAGPGVHPARHLFDLLKRCGSKTSLRAIGMARGDQARAVDLILGERFPNPRPLERAWVEEMVEDAWYGRCPDATYARHRAPGGDVAGPHAGYTVTAAGAPLAGAEVVVVCVHGRGATAEAIVEMFASSLGPAHRGLLDRRVAVVAPQAADTTWWPDSFLHPTANAAHIPSALAVLDRVLDWTAAQGFGPDRTVLYGFSQGACLAGEHLARTAGAARVRWLVMNSGAMLPGTLGGEDHARADLTGVTAHVLCADADAHIPKDMVAATAAELGRLGAAAHTFTFPGDKHAVFAAGRAVVVDVVHNALRRATDPYEYHSGFNAHIESEALPGVIPKFGNTHKNLAYNLYVEQLTGTSFAAKRSEHGVMWYYRINVSTGTHGVFTPYTGNGRVKGTFGDCVLTPEPMRWSAWPIPGPEQKVDFVDGLVTMAGSGDPMARSGAVIYTYAFNADMVDKCFYSADGHLLIVPEKGALDIQTENGFLRVNPTECFVLPRGIKMTVRLAPGSEGGARGFATEVYNHAFRLPERGLIGVDHLAEDRHFQIPKAAYEHRPTPNGGYRMVTKFGGELFVATRDSSPFDVVAWAGNFAPYKYDLKKFSPVMQGKWDHIDPSAHTVLTVPMDNLGNNVLDFVAFVGRWDASEHAFRPPFHHRNHATEFNAVITIDKPYSGYDAGSCFLTPFLSPHGISAASANGFIGAPAGPADSKPVRLTDDSLWIMFESTLPMRVTPWAAAATNIDAKYRELSAATAARVEDFTYRGPDRHRGPGHA